jgi:hypothetical protein
LNVAWQVDPQLIPEGWLVIVPLPAPEVVTLSTGNLEKVAVTEALPLLVTTQLLAPVQAPAHDTKFEPALGVALNVTVLLAPNAAVQVTPQLIPGGLLVTVPVPSPVVLMLSWNEPGCEVDDPVKPLQPLRRERRPARQANPPTDRTNAIEVQTSVHDLASSNSALMRQGMAPLPVTGR